MKTTLDTALAAQELGLQIVIIPAGEKGPRERAWQNKRYTADEIREQFTTNPALNVGVILGPASGVIDLEGDHEDSEADLAALFEGCEIPVTPAWKSRRGSHRLFAVDERLMALGKAVIKFKTVEVRLGAGKAAQSVLPPSTTDGCTREWIVPLCPAAKLPDAVIDRLLATTAPQAEQKQIAKPLDKDKPGDDFCLRATWNEILEPHGWAYAGAGDGVQNWTRPGKSEGISATTGHCTSEQGRDLLYCFSENAQPLEAGHSYSKFAAYTALNHNGDFKAAAGALAEKGYGKQQVLSAAAGLIQLVWNAELFHNLTGDPFATFHVNGHYETHSVDSRQFKRFLEYRYWLNDQKAASPTAITEAIGVIAARARFEGKEFPVATRIGACGDAIYLDLCNEKWQAIEITADGWNVVDRPPVKFRRPNGMHPLPYPVSGSSIDELREFVNVTGDSWTLLVAALVAALRPTGPYPIALFNSEQGSGKSTTMRVCRRLIDPNVADIRSAPNDPQTLMLAATNGLFVTLDNMSKVGPWLADALCRLSTGGGFGTRALYTNDEEKLFDCQRPILVTGISELTTREDFLDRCLILRCQNLPEEKRMPESKFYAKFETARPRILGALLTAVSGALRDLPGVALAKLPRMADFAQWATAAEAGLGWEAGTFMAAYERNRSQANDMALENPLAHAVRKLLDPTSAIADPHRTIADRIVRWVGTASPLLAVLNSEECSDRTQPFSDQWPRSASSLSNKLNRMTVNLRAVGIDVAQDRKIWTLSRNLAA